jgi:iron complex outermembrane receptor protein
MQATFNIKQLTSVILVILTGTVQAAETEPAKAEPVFELQAVQVTASADASSTGLSRPYVGGQVARGSRLGILGSLKAMDAPFTSISYTNSLIKNQQAASIGEVVINDPAVRVARGFGNFQQVYMVRGLPVFSDDMTYNGLYGLLPRQYLGTELVERVDVLRGANAFVNGAAPGGSGLGGAINITPKRAPNEPLNRVTTGIQTGGQALIAGDFARRTQDGSAGVRVNLAKRDGDSAVDGESRDLSILGVGADYRRDGLRLSADVGYQQHDMQGTQPSVTISSGLAIPKAPDASKSLGQDWTYSNAEDTFATLRGEYDFNDQVTTWAALGTRQSEERNVFANPTVTDAQGSTRAYRFDNSRNDAVTTGEVGVRAKLETGAIKHTLSASANAFRLESENAYAFSSFAGFSNNLYAPFDVVAPSANFFTGGDLNNPLVTEKVKTSSLAVADTLSFAEDKAQITIGARQQKIQQYAYDYNTGKETSAYSKSATTPVLGAVYKVSPQVSVYGNYSEGLTKGDVAPATSGGQAVANAGAILSPYKTKQLEAGVKYDTGRMGGSVGVYQSRKPIAGINGNQVFEVLDHQKNRGIEFSAYGLATEHLKVLGGVSLLNSDVKGKDAIGSPTQQANVGLEWAVPKTTGLALDGRVIHTGKQYADAANTQAVPAWTRLDLGARYEKPLGGKKQMTVRARVENVTDKDYWASAGGYPGAGYLTVGAPRTFMLSADFEF